MWMMKHVITYVERRYFLPVQFLQIILVSAALIYLCDKIQSRTVRKDAVDLVLSHHRHSTGIFGLTTMRIPVRSESESQ